MKRLGTRGFEPVGGGVLAGCTGNKISRSQAF